MTDVDVTSRARWSAAALAIVGLVLLVATVALGWDRPAHDGVLLHVNRVLELLAFLTFVLLGALLVLRRPHHPIGWLLAALGTTVLVNQVTQEYALQGLTGAAGPAWMVALWIADWSTVVPLVLLVDVLLLFPTGRPQSWSWGVVVRAVTVAGILLTVGRAVATWPLRGVDLATDGAALPVTLTVLQLALIGCLPVAVASLVLRFRGAGSEQRQQLKLLLIAACGLMTAAVAAALTTASEIVSGLVEALGIVSVAGVAVAMALAVLRYRLYEIDRVVSRTVSYALLTMLLAALYVVGVVVAGVLAEPISSDSNLAVAASTLLVAGAFTPLRSRLQHLVDRRFNRSRYDAEVAIAAFRAQLRDDLRLESLRRDLLTIVARTMQPQRVSLWLRPAFDQAVADGRPGSWGTRPRGG